MSTRYCHFYFYMSIKRFYININLPKWVFAEFFDDLDDFVRLMSMFNSHISKLKCTPFLDFFYAFNNSEKYDILDLESNEKIKIKVGFR